MKNKTSLYLISVAFLLSSCSLGGKKGQENNEQNQNHNSTICTHIDSNNDHLCDSCNIKLTSHKDLDNDHLCDVCSFKMSSHLDDNFDHMCDVCDEKMSEHEDKNNDHLCDICNLKITEHVDENNDNYCDICKSKLEDDEEDDVLNAPIPEKLSYRAGYENTKSVTKPTSGTTTIDLYGINDFHGAIKADSYELGLAQIGSYMKSKTDKANTLFIDSGDTWQGSLESNYNYGNLITDVFSYAHLSARTIGNHDFDWGSRKLLNNTARSYNNYLIPTLGANIYNFDWDSKTVGDVQMYNLGKEYAIYTLDNGLRVGIVGVIGSDQITSISTNNVKSIAFTNHIEKIKDVSDYLRTEKKCDIVIASEHDGYDYEEEELTNVSYVSGKKYVDFVFNAHTHRKENYTNNGVTFAQAGYNGQTIAHATLTYNYSTNSITSTDFEYENSFDIKNVSIDSNIQSIIDDYAKTTDEVGNKVLTNKMNGYFDKNECLVNLMCEAIYERCLSNGLNVDFTYANNARDYLSYSIGENLTYSDLYKAFPFDNAVYIINVKGNQCLKEIVNYNCIYNSGISSVSSYTTYSVAALDYLAFHCNSNRQYDYFPGAQEVDFLKKENGEIYTYREILADYLLANPNKIFNSEDYSSSNTRFSKPSISN